MSVWRGIEVYGAAVRISGDLEVSQPNRLSDVVNRHGAYLELRDAMAEPLGMPHPVLARRQPAVTVSKSVVHIVSPRDPLGVDSPPGNLWRHKERQPMAITTTAYSLIADIHLDARLSLRDHLERHPDEFLPVTTMSALWVAFSGPETLTLQRAFAMLNPAVILSFAPRPSA